MESGPGSESKGGGSKIPPGSLAGWPDRRHVPPLATETILPEVYSLYLINFLGCANQTVEFTGN